MMLSCSTMHMAITLQSIEISIHACTLDDFCVRPPPFWLSRVHIPYIMCRRWFDKSQLKATPPRCHPSPFKHGIRVFSGILPTELANLTINIILCCYNGGIIITNRGGSHSEDCPSYIMVLWNSMIIIIFNAHKLYTMCTCVRGTYSTGGNIDSVQTRKFNLYSYNASIHNVLIYFLFVYSYNYI